MSLSERLHEVTSQLLELTDSRIPLTVEQYYRDFFRGRSQLSDLVTRVHSEYMELSKMQKLLKEANAEDAIAARRLDSDLVSLQATASRTNSELKYIKQERDNLRIRQSSDFPVAPLSEVLNGQPAEYNQEWKELLSNARYSPLTYN